MGTIIPRKELTEVIEPFCPKPGGAAIFATSAAAIGAFDKKISCSPGSSILRTADVFLAMKNVIEITGKRYRPVA
jgi:hypothetical protein